MKNGILRVGFEKNTRDTVFVFLWLLFFKWQDSKVVGA